MRQTKAQKQEAREALALSLVNQNPGAYTQDLQACWEEQGETAPVRFVLWGLQGKEVLDAYRVPAGEVPQPNPNNLDRYRWWAAGEGPQS